MRSIPCRRVVLAVSVALLAVVAVAPRAAAQTTADLEQFRADLAQVLQQLDTYRAAFRQNPSVLRVLDRGQSQAVSAPAEVQELLQRMTLDELAQVHQAFAISFPRWRESPRVLARLTASLLPRPSDASAGLELGIVQNAITPDNCQDAFNAAPSYTDGAIAKGFAIGAIAAFEVIPPPFNVIALAAWVALEEGALASETLNAIFDRCSGDQADQNLLGAIANVQSSQDQNANTILNNLSSAKNEIIGSVNNSTTAIVANDNSNTSQLVANNNSNTSAIVAATNSNTSLILANAGANTATITTAIANLQTQGNVNTTTILNGIAGAQAAVVANSDANAKKLEDLLLRTQIEADLGEADSATPVAFYLTPESNGGHLELVRAIVAETIANIEAAGQVTGQAQAFLAQGDAAKDAGSFKDAYRRYRKAYKAAAK